MRSADIPGKRHEAPPTSSEVVRHFRPAPPPLVALPLCPRTELAFAVQLPWEHAPGSPRVPESIPASSRPAGPTSPEGLPREVSLVTRLAAPPPGPVPLPQILRRGSGFPRITLPSPQCRPARHAPLSRLSRAVAGGGRG